MTTNQPNLDQRIRETLAAIYLLGISNGLHRDISDPGEIVHRREAFIKANPACTEATTQLKQLFAERETELLDSLYWMYTQYCSGGHDFMNAGEEASNLLENAGYIEVDGTGRITKDNGDSSEQKLKKLMEE